MNLEFKELLENTEEVGQVEAFFHSTCFVSGLPNLKLEELIISESGKRGIVHGLRENLAEVLIIEKEPLRIGERVARTTRPLEIEVSEGLLGRIINPLCQPLDDRGPILKKKEKRKIKGEAPPFIERARISENLETGVMLVDLLVPLGYGQRELIIGDPKTGKTTFLLQTLTTQAKKGVICIYVGIGKKDSAVKYVEEYLKKQEVLENCIILHTPPDDSPTLLYLAPFCGMTIAEYFRDKGFNVLIVLDDLTYHAKIYREISLLLKRVPGRDSYPGDIFHLHAQLLERAGNIKKNGKNVSITALPVAETLENDVSGYIQTNLMAMTDGHIFFDLNEFRRGKRPAINAFLSVSRVGNQTKSQIEKEIARWVRRKFLEYERVLEFIQFGAELSKEAQELLELGKKLEALFNQSADLTIEREVQILIFGLFLSDFWQESSLSEMKNDILKILAAKEENKLPKLREKLQDIKDIDHLKFLIKEILPKIEKILL